MIQRAHGLISNSLSCQDQSLDFITILLKLMLFINPMIKEKDLSMKGIKIVTVNVIAYSLEDESQHNITRTRS